MIYIGTTQSKVTVKLYDKCRNLLSPSFTWKLVNSDTRQETVMYYPDFSQNPHYYNWFTFSIATYSLPTGQYDYYVYEMSNPNDLDLDNAINVVDKGILNIIGTQSSTPTYKGVNKRVVPTYKKS
ncbi:MAG: hypothetical protein EOO06_00385 [Chitinophagaceae bacterium]|nr:MAG: hypothetical protein EOO06_00385 [Chitinophagaceae bacterium]